MNIEIKQRILHPLQQEIKDHPAKRKVVVCGRRVGKTTLAGDVAVDCVVEGLDCFYINATDSQTETFWNETKQILYPIIDEGVLYKNETKKIIRTPDNIKHKVLGSVRARTGHRVDSLRGATGHVLILDEYSLMDDDVYKLVILPMTLDYDGTIYFFFTPKRKNHAYKLYLKAVADDTGKWAYWNFSTYENPHLSQSALDDLLEEIAEDSPEYQQEIMAEFLDSGGEVFRNIKACLNAPQTTPANHRGHMLVCGIDWGKSGDYTAVSVGCLKCKCEVLLDRYNQIDYVFQRQRIGQSFKKWGVAYGLAETNAMGEPNLEMLKRDGLPVQGFTTTATTKPQLIENLALAFEREEIQLLDVPVATAELEAYERVTSPKTGRSQYSAPSGMHDDTVIARALMARAMLSYRPALV